MKSFKMNSCFMPESRVKYIYKSFRKNRPQRNFTVKTEATFKEGVFLLHNHWNEKGEQILKDGTGLYVYEYTMFNKKVERNEHEYKNYRRHGVQKTFINGVLTDERVILNEE